MGTELDYWQNAGRPSKAKRHPLSFLFGPLYPLLVAALLVSVAIWYLDLPVRSLFDFDVLRPVRKWLPW